MRVKTIIITMLLSVSITASVTAQPYKGKQTSSVYSISAWEQVKANPKLVLSDYQPYPVTDTDPSSIPQLTKAPKGYRPFYINHYGRHGSRWLISTATYTEPVAFLKKANQQNMLTPLGQDILKRLEVVEQAARGRYGELTRLGAEQHRQIAGRMFKNFPEVFKKDAVIDAKSTIIIRCILSMEAACMRFKELNPKLQITNDASNHDMYYMNNQDPDGFFKNITSDPKNTEILNAYRRKIFKTDRLAMSILKDTSWFTVYKEKFAHSNNPEKLPVYNAGKLFYDIAELAISLPNTDLNISLMDAVTLEELHQLNLYRNLSSYRYAGFSDMGQKVTPFRQTYLLKNIIESADNAIAQAGTDGKHSAGATLRFGHDSNLMPLCSLMDINGAGIYEPNIDNVANVWNMNHYIPKAGNLQFIFYGKKNSPVLVKILLNEQEATLPLETDKFPYYEWSKVREFYINILNQSPIKTELND